MLFCAYTHYKQALVGQKALAISGRMPGKEEITVTGESATKV
jgi:hypothetical protein